MHSYLYRGKPASVTSAAGIKGVLLCSATGRTIFRVYGEGHEFTDYELRHEELGVTIDPEELAAFYRMSGGDVLDHSPEVLGLERIQS
jgi:hypothetical protein